MIDFHSAYFNIYPETRISGEIQERGIWRMRDAQQADLFLDETLSYY